jgi:predicted RNase H-like nuclease
VASAGVDGCPKGWIAVLVDDGGFLDARIFPDAASLAAGVPEADVICVDMPIGLPHGGWRRADELARALVGSSLFMTFPRDVLLAETHPEAVDRAREQVGKGISLQAYSLRAKLLDLELHLDRRMVETHPELAFLAMKGARLSSKHTWNGLNERRVLLAREGVELPHPLARGDEVPPEDVVDAAAAAWSARRVSRGEYLVLPPDAADGEPRIVF